jgi:hypothetical protein
MGITRFSQLQAATVVGGGVNGSSPFGTMYYVDGTNGSDSNNGKSPSKAFATIAAAISASTASKGDEITIAPGTYTITASLAPKAHTIFKAAVYNPRRPSVIITGAVADMVQIDVDGVQFKGIEIKASGAGANNLVDIADTAAVDGVVFEGCVFNGADQTSVVGIQADDATFALTRMTVVDCLFRDLTGTMIDIGALGMAYSYIGYNQFAHDINSGIGIALADTTAFVTGKAWVIEHNVFTAFDATGDEVGISIAGTEHTTAAGIIRNNYFAYGAAATSITIDKLPTATINNYVAAATGGGTLVTTGT